MNNAQTTDEAAIIAALKGDGDVRLSYDGRWLVYDGGVWKVWVSVPGRFRPRLVIETQHAATAVVALLADKGEC